MLQRTSCCFLFFGPTHAVTKRIIRVIESRPEQTMTYMGHAITSQKPLITLKIIIGKSTSLCFEARAGAYVFMATTCFHQIFVRGMRMHQEQPNAYLDPLRTI